ncbi:hypothetical protein ACEPAH_7736 [Sanghuangporus vaninii]
MFLAPPRLIFSSFPSRGFLRRPDLRLIRCVPSTTSSQPFSTSLAANLPGKNGTTGASSSGAAPEPEPDKFESVVGSAPYHTSYTLLRHPKPPSTYPSRLDADFSKIGRELMIQAARRKAVVNFWWDGSLEGEKNDEAGERYPFLTFYFPTSEERPSALGVRIRNGYVTSDQNAEAFFDSPDPDSITTWSDSLDEDIHLLVCTHGSRDCRCSDRGGVLIEALHGELASRRERNGEDSVWNRMKVGETAHVGGHKYAANLLVFPFGDWLAQITPKNVPQVLDAISSRIDFLKHVEDPAGPERERIAELQKNLFAPLIVDEAHWRGRSGLTKEEQVQLLRTYTSPEGR